MTQLTVIFDMDGVILDSERVYQEIERDMYDELGIPVSREEHLNFMGTAEWSMWTYICEKYEPTQTLEELVSMERSRFMERLERPGGIPLLDGLIPLLELLSSEQIPCWIASSSSSEIIARVIDINGLGKYYQGYVSGDDVSESKPSPEIFLKAAGKAGVLPSNCIVIEDSANGIKAARSAGMSVIGLDQQDGYSPDLSGADLAISSLCEINLSVLSRLPGI